MKKNRPGIGISPQIVDKVGAIDIEFGAERDKETEADILRDRPLEKAGGEHAALGDESDVARLGQTGIEAGVEAGSGPEKAHGTRTQNPAALARGHPLDLIGDQVGVFDAKTVIRGEDHHPPNAFFRAITQSLGQLVWFGGNHGQVDGLGDVGYPRIGLDALHALAVAVHRVDDSPVPLADQIAEDMVAHRQSVVVSANDGYTFGIKKNIEVFDRHLR